MKKRILIALLAVLSFSFFGWLLYTSVSFTCQPLVSTNSPYLPGIFYEKNYGAPSYQTAYYSWKNGKWKKGNGDFQRTYRSFYSTEDVNVLQSPQPEEDYGQVMFRDTYDFGTVFVWDNWQKQELFWRIFIVSDSQTQEYNIEKSNAFESLIDCFSWEKGLCLYRRTDQNEIILTLLDAKTGETWERQVSLTNLLKDCLIETRTLYDGERDRLFFFYTQGNEKYLGQYDFAAGQLFSLPLSKPVSHLLITPEGYFLANTSSLRQVILYSYDFDWSEKDSITLTLDIPQEKMGNKQNWYNGNFLALCDGVLYGYLNGEKRDCFYALDTATNRPLSLHLIRPGKGFEVMDVKLYDPEGIQPSFLSLPSGF